MARRGTQVPGSVRARGRGLPRQRPVILALLLAYALVFQVVFASGIMAAQAAGAIAASDLCLGATGEADVRHGADGPSAGIVHCPLCLSRVDAALLPAPPPSPLIERLGHVVRFELAGAGRLLLPAERPAFRPRGPPASA